MGRVVQLPSHCLKARLNKSFLSSDIVPVIKDFILPLIPVL